MTIYVESIILLTRKAGKSKAPPIWDKNECVFQFPQNGYEGIDLPKGIGCGERKIYILAKGYYSAKLGKRVALHFL